VRVKRKTMATRRAWTRSIAALCFALTCSCSGAPDPSAPAVARPVKIFAVGSPLRGVSRAWPGRVEPTQNAELSFNVPGDIVELPIEEGMRVEKGQLLARLDARQLRARLDSEQAQLRFDQTEYDRSSILVERGAVARAELDRRQRALSISKAAVADAKKALGDAELRAPFSGTVAKIDVDNFQSVQAKQQVLVLHDSSSLELVTHVSQRDYAAAKPGLSVAERNQRIGDRVDVVLDTAPDQRLPATLKELASVPDPITGTYEVTWGFAPPTGVNVSPGMTAKVLLDDVIVDAHTPASLRVPIEAVVGSDQGGAHVWVIDPDTMAASAVAVETGELGGDSIEIQTGLEGGELIATAGVHELREGMLVTRFEDIYGDVQRAR
jgi:RND family efflux transporter MFP subunit